MGNRHDIQPGDVFVESWGYDQTNVDAYEVTRVTAHMVEIQPCRLESVGEGHSATLRPVPGTARPFDPGPYGPDQTRVGGVTKRGGAMKKPRRSYRGEWTLTMSTYSNAYLWDGERKCRRCGETEEMDYMAC